MKQQLLLSGTALVALCSVARATTLVSDVLVSGDTPSGIANGTPPWPATLTYTDDGDDVLTTLAATDLSSSEFISQWWLNVPDAAGLSFSIDSTVGSFANPTSGSGNGFGGSYTFDLSFEFETSNSGGDALRFTQGDAITIRWTADDPLNLADFLGDLSTGDNVPLTSGIHIQGIGQDGSAKVGFVVPEPSTYGVLAGLGLLGFTAYRRLRM